MQHIDTYVRPKTDMKASWEDLPENIRDTFDRLGIPEAEKKSLAGVGAQYDSEVVYHNIQKELEEQGVIYVDFETAEEIPGTHQAVLREADHRIIINLRHCTMPSGPAAPSSMCRRASM